VTAFSYDFLILLTGIPAIFDPIWIMISRSRISGILSKKVNGDADEDEGRGEEVKIEETKDEAKCKGQESDPNADAGVGKGVHDTKEEKKEETKREGQEGDGEVEGEGDNDQDSLRGRDEPAEDQSAEASKRGLPDANRGKKIPAILAAVVTPARRRQKLEHTSNCTEMIVGS